MTAAELRDTAMNRRRLDLGMTWRQVAAAAGISYETLRAVRKGETSGGELTLSSLERALRWSPGAFAAIDGGLAPTPATDAPAISQEEGREPPLHQELELAQRLLAATIREMGLTQDEAEAVWQRVRRGLEADRTSDAERPDPSRRRRRAS